MGSNPSRRDFLKTSVVAGVGSGLVKSATQRATNSSSSTSAFDLNEVTNYRPVFATTYFGGFKGTTNKHADGTDIATEVDGIGDWSKEFQHIKRYLDPLITHALFGFRSWPRFEWPDVIKDDPAEIKQWIALVRGQFAGILRTYRENQFQMVMSEGFMVNTGANTGPAWYEKVPHWSELTVDGKVPEASTEDGSGGKGKGIACLANPELFTVQTKFADLTSALGLYQEELIVGVEPENEPGLEVPDFGGNPYSLALFRRQLQQAYGSVEKLNQVLGASYKSFDEVEISNPHPVMLAWADRFRAWLVSYYYQGKLNSINHRKFARWRLSTRFQTYDFTGPRGDISYIADITTDYAGISFYPNAYVNKAGEAVTNRMGMLSGLGSILSSSGHPIALTEFGINKGIEPLTVLTEHFLSYEVTNLLYRGLSYNVRLIGVFWYMPPVIDSWSFVYGMNLSRFPDTLRAYAKVRDEMERIRPYETFGKPIRNSLAILVSRNAIHYPGAGDLYYGALQMKLWNVLDEPELSQFDLVEEHASNLEERLSACRGVVVIDACLRNETRELVDRLAGRGVKVLAIGAPQYLDWLFQPAVIPFSYPADKVKSVAAAQNADRKPRTALGAKHPVLNGKQHWKLLGATPVEPRAGASTLLQPEGSPGVFGCANDRVAYISGLPDGREEWRNLLTGFARWSSVSLTPVVIGQFENAIVLQNYCPKAENLKEKSLAEKVWIGQVAMRDGSWRGQLREMRRDIPWLAYTRGENTLKLEGLRLAAMEVQVIQKQDGKELPHFEGTPESVGYLDFIMGWDHIIAKFEVSEAGEKVLRYLPGTWADKPAFWQVNEVDSPQVIAQGYPPEIHFPAEPGKEYYLIVRHTEEKEKGCPLCRDGRTV